MNIDSWTKKLFIAAKNSDFNLLEEAINNGANVNSINDYDILTVAISFSKNIDKRIIKKLIEHGANPNFIDPDEGKTPLFFASKDVQLVNILVEPGAFADAELPEDGYTSIHYAVSNEYLDSLKALLKTECKSSLNTFDYIGRTPLTIAAKKKQL